MEKLNRNDAVKKLEEILKDMILGENSDFEKMKFALKLAMQKPAYLKQAILIIAHVQGKLMKQQEILHLIQGDLLRLIKEL
jgi:hypothetical protein